MDTETSSSIEITSAPHPGMLWIPGGTFRMGSDHHYSEEKAAHRVTVDGFWMDATPVTNEQFKAFVEATGHVTFCEIPPDPKDYPGALPEMLKAASSVFVPPAGPVSLHDHFQWWQFVAGANWRHPQGAGSSVAGKDDHPAVHLAWSDVEAYAIWAGKAIATEAEWEFAARGGLDGAEYAWGSELVPGRPPGQYLSGRVPLAEPGRRRLRGYLAGAQLCRQRLRPVRHDRQRLGMDPDLVRPAPSR
jgi:sulfatase modifying factor 1